MRANGERAGEFCGMVSNVRSEMVVSKPVNHNEEPRALPQPTTVTQGVLAVDLSYDSLLVGVQGQVVSPEHEVPQVASAEQWGGLYLQYRWNPIGLSFNSLVYRRVDAKDLFHREALGYDLGEHTHLSLTVEGFVGQKEPMFVLLDKEDRVVADVTFMF